MNDLDPGELATTIVHQAHVRRRLETYIAQLERELEALKVELARLADKVAEGDQVHAG